MPNFWRKTTAIQVEKSATNYFVQEPELTPIIAPRADANLQKDFISKMGTVVEEADETLGWLELLVESDLVKEEAIKVLLIEANELTAIMTASKATAIKNHPGKLS